MQVSKNFWLNEFKVSRGYPIVAREIVFTPEQVNRIALLAQSVLQPIRDRFGRVSITSGYRNQELNKLVKGSATSDHLQAVAADIFLGQKPIDFEVFNWIVEQNLPYRQVIAYHDRNIVHVSINVPGLEYKHESLFFNTKGEFEHVKQVG